MPSEIVLTLDQTIKRWDSYARQNIYKATAILTKFKNPDDAHTKHIIDFQKQEYITNVVNLSRDAYYISVSSYLLSSRTIFPGKDYLVWDEFKHPVCYKISKCLVLW